MGTKIHCKSYFPGFYSMTDLNEDSSTSSWPLFYGDKTKANGQYFNGFIPRASVDYYPGHDKDTLKRKMLEHEAVFKNQVCELHRLYRIQRDMMEEAKRKELHKHRASMEPASSSSLQGTQVPSEDARKWHMAGFPLSNSSYGRTSVVGVENFNSPLSCTKGNTAESGQFPFPNGSTSKDCEALDSRPLKVRKKLFDLQLPADEYVDPEEEENLREHKESDISSYTPNGNPKSGPESCMKSFLGGVVGTKIDRVIDVSASAACLRGSIGLADLNEPIQIEEAMAPSSVDFLGHTSENVETKTIHQHAKSTAGYLGATGETMHVRDGFSINSSIGSQISERGWLSHINKAGSSTCKLSSVMQGCQPDKLPLPYHSGQGMYPSGHNREDPWREGFRHGLESSGRSYDQSSNSHLEPVASQTPGSYPFFSSSSFASSWVHSVLSWAKPTSGFTQNVTALETSADSVATTSRDLKPSVPSLENFGGKWHANSCSRLNPGFGNESKLNGFYLASASGSKELQLQSPSAGFNYLNCSRGDKVASDRSTNGFGNFSEGLYHADSKPIIDINLNEALPKSLPNETVIVQDLNTADGKSKPEDSLPGLPWLKPKPVHVHEVANSSRSELSSDQFCCKNKTVRDHNQLFPSKVTSTSWDSEIPRKKDIAQTRTIKKILGFPIFERDGNELSSHAPTSGNVDCHPEGKIVSNNRRNGVIDINVACEPDEQMAVEEPTAEKEKEKHGTFIKDYIDLNSCVSDYKDPSAPCYERKSASVKITLEIDLEVPVFLESEDDSTLSKEKVPDEVSLQSLENKNEQTGDEVLRNAAETILSISSCPQISTEDSSCLPSETSMAEALLWFVDAVSSCADEIVNTSCKRSRVGDGSPQQNSSEEIDNFEAMTLQLAETKEEEYMPKPFVPEIQKVEETGANALTTRSRRGHSRRGRQRRDFQRDILPGLASLSRHEVTEDLQTFGGLMRATGHSWNSGLNRRNGTRNGGARGRRRAVVENAVSSAVCTPLMQQFSNIEAGLEDRSLTGWGKTTRRPRRQRCPAAGNPPTVALT